MNRKTQMLILAAVVLVAANAGLVWKKFFPAIAPQVAKDQQMIQQVAEWESLPAKPLNLPLEALQNEIRHYPQGICSGKEGDTKPGDIQLSQKTKADLVAAIAGLLQCYQQSTPAALVAYMRERGQHVDPDKIKLFKQGMVKDQFAASNSLDAMDDNQLISAAWDWHKSAPKWSGILEGGGSICLWKCRLTQSADTASLGRVNKKLFENETNFFHAFRPEYTFEEACKSQPVLMADIQLVIEHDESRAQDRSPYYVRFWYSPKTSSWQPLQMKLITSGGSTASLADKVPHILF